MKLNYSKTLWKRIQKLSNEMLCYFDMDIKYVHAIFSAVHTAALTQLWCHTETKLYSNKGHWGVAYKWQVLLKADCWEKRNFIEVQGSYTITRKMLLYDNVMCIYHHFTFYHHGNMWNQTKDNSSRFTKWKNDTYIEWIWPLKSPGFQDESSALTWYKNKWIAQMFVFQSLWNWSLTLEWQDM